jgi:predicted glutamine amidotransferase
MIRLSESHDSGWGVCAYPDVGSAAPLSERFPSAAYADSRFDAATEMRGRIFNAHVRRATLGGLSDENTHPFEFGPYSFAHNGTILGFRNMLRPGMGEPVGQTDSECFFMRLMNDFDPIDAYKLGIFELHWVTRRGVAMVASEPLTDERWHSVQQDVLLTLDPENPEEMYGERLLGDQLVEVARIQKLEPDASLRGAERGEWAANFAEEVGSRAASAPA